ncbi:hypothetical protein D6D22_08700 [Aureobasidium pullulans]|uniref:Carboxylesterase type B domain-containing protein n=1 Tax=Aureobasidium pullulans TaxID=5580 RepID=A0A4S8X4W3_AURPU|nr:hypothetical protein D6D22_08700 [Aureobasidium pullulans]
MSKYLEHDGVVQYLGVRYADLENGFAEAQMRKYTDLDSIDATVHGPSAISPPQACELEHSLIQKSLPMTDFPQSDTLCLNLNITAPAGIERTSSKLPVFVFIHGGGYSIGSNAWPQYDQTRIVKLSSDLGRPVIGVGINYRLGPFGFMLSKEMQDYGFHANNGLVDQQVALLWTREHISLFGGDPNRVTCVGESAGAISTMHQLQMSPKSPPFQQCISMGGNPLMMKPLPDFVAEGVYRGVINSLGLEKLSASERKSALLSMPAAELLSRLPPGLPFLPVQDGRTICESFTFLRVKSGSELTQSTATRILIGTCDMDSSVLGVLFAPKQRNCLKRFAGILKEIIPHDASEVMKTYGIKEDMSDADAWLPILKFATDINFHAPARVYASAWSSDAYLYRFREPNPWTGAWEGYASHVLDVAYLFLNYTEDLTPSRAEIAREFAADFITFINGEAPFKRVKEEPAFIKEYLSTEGRASMLAAQDESYDTRMALMSRVGYDSLLDVWAQFMSR